MPRRVVFGGRHSCVCLPALAACAVCLAGCSGGGRAAQREPQTDGKTLYTAYCLSCHGADGRNDRSGALPAMRLAALNTLPPQAWTALVWNGRGAMPAFRGRLSPTQTDALRAYILRLTTP